jgi:hypothetical protein
MAHITAGVSTTGAVGLGINAANPFFNRITNGVDISLQNGSIQTIAGNSQEIWAFASVNFGQSQILRYDASNGNFLGVIDATNTTVPGLTSNFSARALYFDERGRRWIGLLSGGLIVKDGDSLVNINFPQIFPSGTAVSANAIAKGEFGSILIGTSQGLVIYSGGDATAPESYKRLTTAYGLPSNNVLDVIRRGDGLIIVATDAGIAFLKK